MFVVGVIETDIDGDIDNVEVYVLVSVPYPSCLNFRKNTDDDIFNIFGKDISFYIQF